MSSVNVQAASIRCVNCDRTASMRCTGCNKTPEYTPGDSINIVYCDHECQKTHWPQHKVDCNTRQRRRILLRSAMLLKATVLAYRECCFDLEIDKIDFQDGSLRLHQKMKPDRPRHTPFPSNLTSNVEHKEAALANNQCTLAMALLGPLTRHLLRGVTSGIAIQDISVGKSIFTTKLIPGCSFSPNYVPPHTVIICVLENGEKWIIDATGCQYGFRDVLSPLAKYMMEKQCKYKHAEGLAYDATETKDVDYFLTIPSMSSRDQDRKKWMDERAARLHFAEFIKARAGPQFSNTMVSGSAAEFEGKLSTFVGDLKAYMTEFVEQASGKIKDK